MNFGRQIANTDRQTDRPAYKSEAVYCSLMGQTSFEYTAYNTTGSKTQEQPCGIQLKRQTERRKEMKKLENNMRSKY
jgi:hypothetical protein